AVKVPPLLSADLKGRRVLVVDDNENARIVLADMLGAMSFNIDQVSSGKEAIDAVIRAESQDQSYDIVFLDWQMPGMDGIEAARKLRAEKLAHLPHLVMVTAYGREEVIRGAEEASLEDVLIKPVSASTLFDSVVRVLGGRPVERRMRVDGPSLLAEQLATIKGARVLLVEDNLLNQEVAMELLRDAGFQVDLAENGEIAVAKIQQASYDIVLMDMQMPVMDGMAATREIRQLPGFASLPIVAMTANAMEGDRQRCLAAGMNDHVAKPIEPDDLWQALLKWVKARHSTDAGSASAGLPSEAPALPAGIAAIAGLDVSNGLRRVLGKTPLYLRMLRRFIDGQGDAIAAIHSALDNGDLETAERLAHTARGSAGNIGATELESLAAQVESGIKDRQPRVLLDQRLEQLARPLELLIASIEGALPAEQASTQIEVDMAALRPMLENLDALLAYGDASAIAVLDDNVDQLRAAFPKHFRAIDNAIRAIDFEAARSALREATDNPGQ
ncbi:MAG: response regulator, partial [Arenimonas sp.]